MDRIYTLRWQLLTEGLSLLTEAKRFSAPLLGSAVGPLRWDLLTHSATNAKYSFWFVGMRRLHDTQALVTRLANGSFVKLMHEVKEAYHLWSIENYVSGSHLLSSFVTMVTLWGLVCYSSF